MRHVVKSAHFELLWGQINRQVASSSIAGIVLAVVVWLVGPRWGATALALPALSQAPKIVFMTDFGNDNDAVSICKGVIYSIAPDVRIIDLTHEVKPYSVLDGARFLFGASPYYPAGTIFLAVVDPGVGSARKAVLVKTRRGQFYVLPDNGLVTLVVNRDGIEGAREITNPSWMIGKALSSTFHGRDLFSPAAAHLARGENWTTSGPEVKRLVRLDLPVSKLDSTGLHGEILALDTPYGSLISNIDAEDFEKLGYSHGDTVSIILRERKMVIPYARTFSDVPLGEPLLYIDSRGHLGLALNQGDFSRVYNVKPPAPILVLPRNGRPAR
jgi:S-adenosyl-L-methionine hydrolase (adenosine-forming)